MNSCQQARSQLISTTETGFPRTGYSYFTMTDATANGGVTIARQEEKGKENETETEKEIEHGEPSKEKQQQQPQTPIPAKAVMEGKKKKAAEQEGKVFVISKNMRGPWANWRAKQEELGAKIVLLDVTSASTTHRNDFSPMYLGKGMGKGKGKSQHHQGKMCCFENWWQSGKLYQGLASSGDRKEQLAWWRKQVKGKRRYPRGKGRRVLGATWKEYGDKVFEYVPSRQQVYIPEYWELVRNKRKLSAFRKMVQEGVHVGVVDFDGPRGTNGEPLIEEVSLDLIADKVQDLTFPFGHCYVVAAGLKGWTPSMYTE